MLHCNFEMENKKILLIFLTLILVTTFFFKTIPIPVESIDGNINQEEFVYGGMYWTSGLYELGVKNYVGVVSYFLIFIIMAGGIKIWE